ncbi:hypothetical protein Tco_1473915 [Tanacetum coccineum]
MSALKFADSHNMVEFLAKPIKSEGFEQIVDFLNANPIKYALTVNPTIYTSCIEQFWATAKNMDSSVKFLMYPRFVQAFLDKQVGDMSTHDEIFVTPSHTKKEEMGEGSANPTDPYHTPIITQPSTSKPQKKQKPRKPKRKDIEIPQSSGPTEPIADEAANKENVPTHSNDLLLSEISSLKLRVKRLEKKGGSRIHKLKRLFKVGRSAQVVSSEDEGLGDQEDTSNQGRKITNIEQDAEVTLVDETQGRYNDAQMFDTYVFNGEEVFVAEQSEKVVEEVVSTTEVSAAAIITTEEITLAQALAELRSAKPKVMVQEPVQSTITTTPSTIHKAKSITFRYPTEEEEQARLAREKAKKVEEANILWDNVQAMIEADRLLAERLQAREQEELTDEEKARFQLKNKSFAEIQKLFDKAMTRVNMFVDMDTELVKESSKKAEAEMAQESITKRAGEELE